MKSPVKFWPIREQKLEEERDQRVIMASKVKWNCLQNYTTYFTWILKKWTWACDHLKTSYFSAGNFKTYLTSLGRHLSPRYGQLILVSRYPILTAINWSQHWCPICVHYQFPCALELARKYEIEHWSRSSKAINWSADIHEYGALCSVPSALRARGSPAIKFSNRNKSLQSRSHEIQFYS